PISILWKGKMVREGQYGSRKRGHGRRGAGTSTSRLPRQGMSFHTWGAVARRVADEVATQIQTPQGSPTSVAEETQAPMEEETKMPMTEGTHSVEEVQVQPILFEEAELGADFIDKALSDSDKLVL
ncbi:hypothetical protein U1Q18_000814, partial [Sarracenia purpurea var. burkii]